MVLYLYRPWEIYLMNPTRRKPNTKEKLYILVEGMGDKKLLENLFANKNNHENCIQTHFDIVFINVEGVDNIIYKLIEFKRTFIHSNVFIFIDLDDKGKQRVEEILRKLNKKGVKKFLKTSDFFFVNPIIEYLYVLGKDFKNPKFYFKHQYKPLIRRLFGIDNYCSSEAQINIMIKQLKEDKFNTFLINVTKIEFSKKTLPSSNINELIKRIKK